ncbi:hypothetical protein TNCV_664051 [Trichonephila clavipes]|nr:hypothetical protein TNCV_664051 [Trichonephila clavipes]
MPSRGRDGIVRRGVQLRCRPRDLIEVKNNEVCHPKPSCCFNPLSTHDCLPLSQYDGNDTQFVIEWARVRIPNKAWVYLREKVGLSSEMDSRLEWKAALLFCSVLGSSCVIKSTVPGQIIRRTPVL